MGTLTGIENKWVAVRGEEEVDDVGEGNLGEQSSN